MPDIVQTPASVKLYEDASFFPGQAGELIERGDVVYLVEDEEEVDVGKYKLASDATEEEANASGIAITPAPVDGHFVIQYGGGIDVGGVLAVGVTYGVSDTPGKLKPVEETASLKFPTTLGIAIEASRLFLVITATGVQKA
jgi:hypothetical protein